MILIKTAELIYLHITEVIFSKNVNMFFLKDSLDAVYIHFLNSASKGKTRENKLKKIYNYTLLCTVCYLLFYKDRHGNFVMIHF